MEGRQFDRIAKGLSSGASRRRVLAGLGLAATGSLVSQGVQAAPSERGQCNRLCTSAAKTARQACREDFEGRAKGNCLREAARAQAECKAECREPDNGGQ